MAGTVQHQRLIRDLRTCLRMSAKIKPLTSSVPPLDDRVLADVRL
jgi:hypothetical protein